MQQVVDVGQQQGDAEAADDAQPDGKGDDQPVGFEQAEEFAKGARGRLVHAEFLVDARMRFGALCGAGAVRAIAL